ncbi:hypothetical protein CDES_03770 [Corynebacterium deserti GIMN1.010]|uniref:SIS domain-containing protein n=1 Tax=Corynebacterium deserti GIMN1.010 TaxID=931089 RepID=A0A0M5IFV8_9CORY|nr:hypothetical protein [Corynebacterium deserti]ALC05206.1 hypothetical protein CDES_03770 [Corynebacterium deserti GIMN1.010]
MADEDNTFYDGSAYDPETVKFFDVAQEGAQVRLIGNLVAQGAFRAFEGLRPRSVVVLSQGVINHNAARLVETLHSPMRQPLVITSTLPQYIGALDVLVVITDNGADDAALKALITAAQRGVATMLVGPGSGPLIDESPHDTFVLPILPTATGLSPARIVASISTLLDLFEVDQQIIADRLDHVADRIDEEAETLSPERDELVNPGRKLRAFAENARIVHTGRSDVGLAIAHVIASLWTRRGLVSTSLDYAELYESLPELRGPEPAVDSIFHDPFLDDTPMVVPFKAVVWAEEDPGIPDAMAQSCDGPSKGALTQALRLLVRGQSATIYSIKEKDL